jgi:MFS transporter, FHS family, Na+ dependent glucose transporter 1
MSSTAISLPLSRGRAYTYRLTAAYFAAFVALGLTTGSLGPTLPSLAEQTQVGLSAISYVFAARSLGYVVGSVRLGKLFDRKPGNPVMAGMLFAMAIMMTLVPLAPKLWLLLVTMLVLGVAEAGIDVGANTLLGWAHGKSVGPFMNAMHSCFGVGALIAPIVVAQTVSFKLSPTNSYWLLALLLLPVGLFVLRLPSPHSTAEVAPEEHSTTKRRQVFLIALFLFLYVGAEVGFAGWIFTYATTVRLSDAGTAAYLTSLFWGSLTLGRMLTIPIAARFKPGSILMGSLGGCLVSLGLMLVSPSSFAALLAGTICLGLSMASIFPTTLSFANHRIKLTGQVTGWFIVASSTGSMLIPLVIGQAFPLVGPRAVMLVTTAMLLTAAGVLTCVIRNSEPTWNEAVYGR